jgi:F0F1-type ATP synthase assembly protein I
MDEDEDDKNQKGDINWRQALTTVGLAMSIPFMIGVPAFLGWYADKHYDTAPLWFLVGLFAGLIGTAVDIYKLLKRFGQFK